MGEALVIIGALFAALGCLGFVCCLVLCVQRLFGGNNEDPHSREASILYVCYVSIALVVVGFVIAMIGAAVLLAA